MNRTLTNAIAGLLLAGLTALAQEAEVGKPAPEFSAADTTGATNTLSAFKGKCVVLEWTNPDCPFVKKHYSLGNMQTQQGYWTRKGVIWLTICSSAPGKQGFYAPAALEKLMKEKKAEPTAIIPDPDGTIGRLYGAKTTPHLFVIDKQGMLAYAGAIDDRPSTEIGSLQGATNYLTPAIESILAGKPLATPATKPYGCSVKYKD